MLSDGANTYTYNAESEITTAEGVNYTYDGDGNRVEKSGVRIYWYGAGSEILDETDLSGNIQLEMVYFGGKRVAHRTSSNVIYYYEGDLLGSARTKRGLPGRRLVELGGSVQAGQTSVCYDADFSPFGGERVITDTCSESYKFEGKKRDNETGNDDFGARYYRWNIGRWLSAAERAPRSPVRGAWEISCAVPAPVPYANLTNPQTLNLYAMVSDNPETFADLDGHVSEGGGPYNLETGDSSAGSDGQGHTCDKMGSDCSMQENANTNVNGKDQDQAQQQGQTQQINKDKIVDTMDKNAHGTNTYNGYCATACRKGLQAGGVKVPLVNGHRYPNANEYRPVLLKNGALIVPQKGYVPQKGDVVVFQGGGPHSHPNGHIAIYDGKQWVSDTRQTQMAPNRSGYPGGYTIYRFPN